MDSTLPYLKDSGERLLDAYWTCEILQQRTGDGTKQGRPGVKTLCTLETPHERHRYYTETRA